MHSRSRFAIRFRARLVGFASTSRQRGAVLLAVGLGAYAIIADFLQIRSSGGYWAWLALFSILATALLVLLFVSPILRRNIRGAWLFSVLRRTGLIDVENRADRDHRLPPVEIFHEAGSRPVLISGILDQFFQNRREDIVDFLRRGGELRVLLLHPRKAAESLDVTWVRHREKWIEYWMTNCNEALVALDAIVQAGLDANSGFQVRFMTEIPPYLGTLIGGPTPSNAQGPERSFVRVQPLAVSKFEGRGSVITFEQISGTSNSPFNYYAEDLMEQWNVALKDADLIRERRAALRANDR
jgi:hypothetical protein